MSAVDVDCIVVGAGVVGLGVAHALAIAGREVWVLETNERAGEGVSSRNSGVIHAGFYYEPGSLKARLCVRGVELMYEYCARRSVGHRRTGKLVVAVTEAELPALKHLEERAQSNSVPGVRWVDADEARRLEPHVHCAAALESPNSGIVDVPELVMALSGEIEQRGGKVICRMPVAAIEPEDGALAIVTVDGDRVRCRTLINAAGIGATALGHATKGLDARHIPQIHFSAGHYYTVRGRPPFQRLIYPLPEPSALGVHLGFDMAGRIRFGPDARWQQQPDYHFDDSQRSEFADGIRRWWPELKDSDLAPDFVGVRPKLSGPGEPAMDFCIQGPSVHGIAGLTNLFGIDSPGLTSSLAIGEEVQKRIAAGDG